MINKFIIDYNKEENKIYINCKLIIEVLVSIYNWNTTTDELSIIYETISIFNNNIIWYQTGMNLYDLNGIKIEIKQNNVTIKEEFFRFRTSYGDKIKNQFIIFKNDAGIGDNLTVTPIIRKMYNIYNQKINIFTYMPHVFINNPYINNVIEIKRGNGHPMLDIPEFYKNDENEIHELYSIEGLNIRTVDHRQISAWNLGFELPKDELNMDFFPDDYIDIPDLPDKFVCINPSITHKDRTWDQYKWQMLINMLEKHIPIVAIGKTTYFDKYREKSYLKVNIKNGLNLMDMKIQNTLSQAYHIINKSETFVTMNNGLYILSLCTDSHITQLGTPWNTENNFRIRNGIKDYKLNYVVGNCKLHCLSDLKTAINENGNTNIIYSGKCYLNKDTYECHPTPEQVYEKIIEELE